MKSMATVLKSPKMSYVGTSVKSKEIEKQKREMILDAQRIVKKTLSRIDKKDKEIMYDVIDVCVVSGGRKRVMSEVVKRYDRIGKRELDDMTSFICYLAKYVHGVDVKA